MCTYAGIAGYLPPDDYSGPALETIHKALSPNYGDVPDNGAFLATLEKVTGSLTMVGERRKLSQITDGQSNSFMIGEFVHRDCRLSNLPRAFSRKPQCSTVVYRQLFGRAVPRKGG